MQNDRDFSRWIHDPETGSIYVASMAAMELPVRGGISTRFKSLVFETTSRRWIGSTPISTGTSLEALSTDDLFSLLTEAVQRG